MAYDEDLAERVRDALLGREALTERKMFGGIAFMLHGHMCCGVVKDELMVRLSVEEGDRALDGPGTRPMDFTGRPMSGFLFVSPSVLGTDEELQAWVDRAAVFVSGLPPK
jgi:TfoX/Sxy family transcriptional regulator of competence genes